MQSASVQTPNDLENIKITQQKGFTLTELLVALGIIGAIAVLAIPSLLNSINNRMLTTQLKSIVESIQQLANEQLVKNKTKNLSETDFASPASLLSSSHFNIAKTCSNPARDCWKTAAANSTKVSYKTLSGGSYNTSAFYHSAVVLKNGAIINYYYTQGSGGLFMVDVNGNEPPNICGRDLFSFTISKKGRITSASASLESKITNCKKGEISSCFDAVLDSGWKMPY